MEGRIQVRKRPKFLLSNFDVEERTQLSAKIKLLGGILYESSVSITSVEITMSTVFSQLFYRQSFDIAAHMFW